MWILGLKRLTTKSCGVPIQMKPGQQYLYLQITQHIVDFVLQSFIN